MTGEKDLHTLLATMHPVLRDGEFVYVLWPHGRPLAGGIAAAVREAEGLTVVMPRADADGLGLPYDFVAAWITLEVHSSLEAVGLTAAVAAALTAAKISCNVLAGFHHDHLLVPVTDADRALEILHELAEDNGRPGPAPEHLLRTEQPGDRSAVLAIAAAAFAISPAAGEPVDGEPEEVELLRRHGIDTALMKETVARANAAGERGIARLGSPGYYSRFGFVPSTSLGVAAPHDGWGAHFQLLPLAVWPGGVNGTFRYAGPFTD